MVLKGTGQLGNYSVSTRVFVQVSCGISIVLPLTMFPPCSKGVLVGLKEFLQGSFYGVHTVFLRVPTGLPTNGIVFIFIYNVVPYPRSLPDFLHFLLFTFTLGSCELFQLANNFAHGRACVGIPVNTPLNEPSQSTSHPTYLIMELLRIRYLSDAHFTQKHAETVHVHLEEGNKSDSCIKYGHDLRDNTCINGKPLLKSTEMLFKPYTLKRI